MDPLVDFVPELQRCLTLVFLEFIEPGKKLRAGIAFDFALPPEKSVYDR